MARKSRKEWRGGYEKQDRKEWETGMEVISQKEGEKTGIYVRLSVADNGYENRVSLKNQVVLLESECIRKGLRIKKIYEDNGSTGVNFKRKGWETLLHDIEGGEITCVMVKDFSRIGRNYIEVGNYLECFFPSHGIRVISINDNYDSMEHSFYEKMLECAFANLVNEYYARDISSKISKIMDNKRKRGEWCSPMVPYGYQKIEDNGINGRMEKVLRPEHESASVVKKIFNWRACGMPCCKIADYLNILAVPSPGQYRFLHGDPRFARCANTKWKALHIDTILNNKVYRGHLIQGKTRTSYFENSGVTRQLDKSLWRVKENSHEPLVSEDVWQKVKVQK